MIEDFLKPTDIDTSKFNDFGKSVTFYLNDLPDLEQIDIALIGVKDSKEGTDNESCSQAPDMIRAQLMKLEPAYAKMRIADLGNIAPGATFRDTAAALYMVVEELLSQHVVPIIIGGGYDLLFAQYKAYERFVKDVELVAIDSRIDLADDTTLHNIIMHEPNYLFNLTCAGYQTYFVNQKALDVMERMYFDMHRLGFLRNNMEEAEPILRNAHIAAFNMSAIKQADAPGNYNSSPNGFTAHEACQIARYAGLSNKLRSFGLYELNPEFDNNHQTAKLAAQMIWYFIDGYYNRKNDDPYENDESGYMKYRTSLSDSNYEILFLKSKKTDRWWMQVPHPKTKENTIPLMVPCSYNDYQTALNDEMPDRWWRAHQKLI